MGLVDFIMRRDLSNPPYDKIISHQTKTYHELTLI